MGIGDWGLLRTVGKPRAPRQSGTASAELRRGADTGRLRPAGSAPPSGTAPPPPGSDTAASADWRA